MAEKNWLCYYATSPSVCSLLGLKLKSSADECKGLAYFARGMSWAILSKLPLCGIILLLGKSSHIDIGDRFFMRSGSAVGIDRIGY